MKAFDVGLIFFLMTYCSFVTIKAQQSLEEKLRSLQQNKNDQHETQKKEYELEEQFKKQVQRQLNEWIVKQMRQNQQFPEVLPHQSAIFYLKPNVTHIYRIPALLNQRKLMEVSLFQVAPDGQIVLPDNPEQNNFVEVLSYDEKNGLQYKEGIVYISKIFQIKLTHTHKFLKFKNRAQQPLLVLLDMEQEQLLMDLVLSDDQFEITKKKIKTILQESKNVQLNREHIYKWQWGFYEKHKRHQSDMLGFTAAELLIIIATSIVQMYCIKNLINNELII